MNVSDAAEVINSIARACKDSGCALIGGETAEMPGMYKKGDFDLAGFAVGAVEREMILPKQSEIKVGDFIIALPSSGVHSNGFSLVRKIMEIHNLQYDDFAEFDTSKTYAEIFLEPTKLYVKDCLSLHKKSLVKAFCHITGGGFTENIPRILPSNLSFSISSDYELPKLFSWLQEKANLSLEELYKTFNCGAGMVAIMDESSYKESKSILDDAFILGKITKK